MLRELILGNLVIDEAVQGLGPPPRRMRNSVSELAVHENPGPPPQSMAASAAQTDAACRDGGSGSSSGAGARAHGGGGGGDGSGGAGGITGAQATMPGCECGSGCWEAGGRGKDVLCGGRICMLQTCSGSCHGSSSSNEGEALQGDALCAGDPESAAGCRGIGTGVAGLAAPAFETGPAWETSPACEAGAAHAVAPACETSPTSITSSSSTFRPEGAMPQILAGGSGSGSGSPVLFGKLRQLQVRQAHARCS